jgi:uncharacterized membrane protein YbhN (UPF0104 family)
MDMLSFRTLANGAGAMTIGWFCMGLSLWAVLRSMGLAEADLTAEWPRYTASVSLAMVAGFLSLIPGGAVVREAILAALMVPHLGEIAPSVSAEAAALVSAVLLRLVWLGSEVLISGLLFVRKPRPSEVL